MVRASVILGLSLWCTAPRLGAQALKATQQFVCSYVPIPSPSTSTRGLAMGDANITGRDDDVIFYNPARLAVARGTSVAGERYAERSSGGTMATVARLARGGVAIGGNVTARTQAPCNDAGLPPPQPTVSETIALGTVGIGQTIKRYQLGAAVKFRTEQGSYRRSRVGVDVGIARDMSAGSLPIAVGIAVQNVANHWRESFLPLRAALGASTAAPLGPFDLAIAAQVASDRQDAQAGGGIELGYQWLDGYSLALRTGGLTGTSSLVRAFTGGVGLQLDRVSIDYAFQTQVFNSPLAHRIGLRLR